MVVFHALGECVIRTSVATITPRADLGFALASHLIAKRGKRISRQALLLLFWPAAPAAAAAHALSEALHKLRRKGLPVCGDDTYSVWLAHDAVSTDIEHLASEPPRALLDRDFRILPGYSPTGSPQFHDWLDDWRDDLQQLLLTELLDATKRAEHGGDSRAVLGLADELLKLDPCNKLALAAAARAVKSLQRNSPNDWSERGACSTEALPEQNALNAVNAADEMVGARVVRERARDRSWSLPPGGFPAARDTPLVGRTDDIVLGVKALDGACGAAGCGMYISGAAGVGKSRFVRALAGAARARDMVIASVTCQESDVGRPLSALVDVVPTLRNLPGAAGCSPTLLPYLDRLTRHTANDLAPSVDGREVEHIHACVTEAVFDLVDSVSEEQPLLLVIENIQWLDPLSWTLLRDMSKWATRRSVAFLFTSRDGWCEGSWGEPPDGLALHPLLPLTDEAATEHAADYARAIAQVPPPELLRWCTAASEGNPYLLEELLNHWAATNEQFATPKSLTALLDARLERLGPTALRVLQECAIMGRNSTLSRIERLLDHPLHELFGALEDLGSAGMLTTERDEDGVGNNRALCRHDALAHAAIKKLSGSGLELLHRRAGEVLEAELGGPDSASLLWDCAGHWHAAGNSVRAVELGQSCISHLLEIGLAHDAADGCRRTLSFCTRDVDRIDVLTTLAHVLHLTRSWAELSEVLRDIRNLQFTEGTYTPPHDDLELLQLDAEWHAHRDWESALCGAVCCARSEAAEPYHRVRAGIIALKIATNLGRTGAIHETYGALEHVALDASVPEVDRLMLDMIYHAVCGNQVRSAAAACGLLARVHTETPEIRYFCVRLNCATALCRAGEFAKGEREYIDIFDRAMAIHAYAIAGEVSQHLMKTYIDAGDMDRAEMWAHHYIALRRPGSELWQQRPLRLALARIELWRGNIDAADHLLQNSDDPLWNDSVPAFQAAALAAKVRIELSRCSDMSAIADLTARLDVVSARLRSLGWQDFETFSLYVGMRHVGRKDDAMLLLTHYVEFERRDLSPLSAEITGELEAAY